MSNTDGEIPVGDNKPSRGAKREPLPAGDYLFEIAWVEKTLSQKGTPRLSFRFRVVAGPHKGRLAFDDCYLSATSLWRLQGLAALIGIPKGSKINPNDQQKLVEQFQGKQFHGTVRVEDFQGKAQHRVGWKIDDKKPSPAMRAAPADAVPVVSDAAKATELVVDDQPSAGDEISF